ncbi:hypothetical protein SMD44_06890 [Streptomyces alboflavus]|uniref:Uncharacterized protein n=1 Tax=Streptomyces alboflavus TaxID=67267 RepID=A0A1Z1WLZ8_9ACTN|nr:hypothetical protein SMD44_06890 [Streptomyces alboflavus]
MQRDARGPHQAVEAGGLEALGVERQEPGGDVVPEVRHRLAVGEAQALHQVDLAALGHPEGGGGLGGRGLDDVAQDPGLGPLPGRLQVVVEAAELQRALDLAVHDLGADAPAAHQEALVDEGLDGLADGGPGQAEAAREVDLVAEEAAGRQGAALDRRLQLL